MSGGASWRDDPRFAKECGCVDHSVPHWLWKDRMDRERVRDAVARMKERAAAHEAAPTFLNQQALWTAIVAVGALDKPRVAEKLANMRRLTIDVLPPDLVEQVETEWAAPRKSALSEKERAEWAAKTQPRPPPPPPAPKPPRPPPTKDEIRAAAMAVEMAASPVEKKRLQAEFDAMTKEAT